MSQVVDIRKHLESGRSISPIEALNLYGCFRLAARISDLKNEGMDIKMRYAHKNGKQYAEYYLDSVKPGQQQIEFKNTNQN